MTFQEVITMREPERKPLVYPTPEKKPDKPIPERIYPTLDTDLARDNLENNLTEADKQDW